jgi:D-alanyl-D-alanine dipeptidase
MKSNHSIDPAHFADGKFAEILRRIYTDQELELELERLFTLDDVLGFRSHIPLSDNGEKLVPIEDPQILFFSPHPYQSLGAPYGQASPFVLREGLVERLRRAQRQLSALRPGFRLKIFDGFRPLSVQSYMVEYTFMKIAEERSLETERLSHLQREEIYGEVFKLFARPNPDPQAPPPHSTGGAVDLTIVDERGEPIDMGSEIDSMPPLSHPNHFFGKHDRESVQRQANRDLLRTVMVGAGFERLPREWWHFSYGDQLWALVQTLKEKRLIHAKFGRVNGH